LSDYVNEFVRHGVATLGSPRVNVPPTHGRDREHRRRTELVLLSKEAVMAKNKGKKKDKKAKKKDSKKKKGKKKKK
jgi:hypothetical protein